MEIKEMIPKQGGKRGGPPKDPYTKLVPERMFVENEIYMLLALHKVQRELTAFEISQSVAHIKGDLSRSMQTGAGLKQLLTGDLIDSEVVTDERTKRKVTKYRITPKGNESAELFIRLFTLWKQL